MTQNYLTLEAIEISDGCLSSIQEMRQHVDSKWSLDWFSQDDFDGIITAIDDFVESGNGEKLYEACVPSE